jgi:hypothetical protein
VSGRDISASVRQRLLNRSRAEDRPFQELLQYFGMERFLYRLAKSPYADRFILKGALLLTAWCAPLSRPTMDIDLAGRTNKILITLKSSSEQSAKSTWTRTASSSAATQSRSAESKRTPTAKVCESNSTPLWRGRAFPCSSILVSEM